MRGRVAVPTGRRIPRAFAAALAAAAITLSACSAHPGGQAAAAPPLPTPGCPGYAWESYTGLTDLPTPDGVALARTPDGVRISNRSARAWSVRAEWWTDHFCFGWSQVVGVGGGSSGSLPAGGSLDLVVPDPGSEGALGTRIGVAFWDHPCPEGCNDPAAGFGWVDAAPGRLGSRA